MTSVARTILDLGALLPTPEFEELVGAAYAGRLVSRDALLAIVRRHRGRPGAPALRVLLDSGADALTRSQAERRFLALVRSAQLPRPRANVRLHGYEVDFLWAAERLVVEVDGHAFHAARPQRERDSRRDQELTVRGYAVMRVTWHQITRDPDALITRIAASLARQGPG